MELWRQREPTARLWRCIVITMFVLPCCTAKQDSELHALWYPNVTYTQTDTATCRYVLQADDTVNTEFHVRTDLYTPRGVTALRLEAGQNAIAYGPDPGISGSETACWMMLARWEDVGTLLEFPFGSEKFEVIVDTGSQLKFEPNSSWYRPKFNVTYVKDTSRYWQPMAFCFSRQSAYNYRMHTWAGDLNNKRFELLYIWLPYNFPKSVTLGYCPMGGRVNPVMEVKCLMVVVTSTTDMTEAEMDDLMTKHCGQLPSVSGTFGGHRKPVVHPA